MSRLESLASVVPSQFSMGEGKLPNLSWLNVSKHVVMSFCVAGKALRDIPTCFMTSQKSFCVAGAILLRLQKMRCIFRGRRSTLELSCCAFFANRNVRAARSGDTHNSSTFVHSTLYTPHFTLYTPHFYNFHFTLYTPCLLLRTLHFRLHTLHSTLCTTLSTPHFTPRTLHFTLHTSHFLLHALHFTLHTLHSLSPFPQL